MTRAHMVFGKDEIGRRSVQAEADPVNAAQARIVSARRRASQVPQAAI